MFWKKKINKTTKVAGISPGIEKSILILLGSKGLPIAPMQAQKAFELSLKTEIEASDFIDLIESEESLSARIIKIANSAFFGRKEKSETIQDAVVVIGIEELKNILCANALKDLFPSSNPFRNLLWKHDIAVGIASRIIAERELPNLKSQAFLAGLMHDIGKLLLFQRYENEVENLYKDLDEKIALFQAEEDAFLCNHAEIGFLIAQKWNFTESIKNTICYHHKNWDTPEIENSPITKIVKAADIIVHYLGLIEFPNSIKLKDMAKSEINQALKEVNIKYIESNSIYKRITKTYLEEAEIYS